MHPCKGALLCLYGAVLGQCATITRQPRGINTPVPMLEPLYPACEQFHLAGDGETCFSITDALALPFAEFARLNPVLGPDGEQCGDNILPGYFYCVKALPGDSGGQTQPQDPKASAGQHAGVVIPPWLRGGLLDEAVNPELRGKKPKPKPEPKTKPAPTKKKPAPRKKPKDPQPPKLAPGASRTQDQLDSLPACKQ